MKAPPPKKKSQSVNLLKAFSQAVRSPCSAPADLQQAVVEMHISLLFSCVRQRENHICGCFNSKWWMMDYYGEVQTGCLYAGLTNAK